MATFHTSNLRSRAMQAAYPLLRPSLEKIAGRIAVSRGRPPHRHDPRRRRRGRHPQRRLRRPLRRAAPQRPEWTGHRGAPDDRLPRADRRAAQGPAGPRRRAARGPAQRTRARGCSSPGPATPSAARERWPRRSPRPASSSARSATRTRPSLLASVDLYVAPHTGGESFGIVLIEAMSAGAPVARQRPAGLLAGARRRRGGRDVPPTRTPPTSPAQLVAPARATRAAAGRARRGGPASGPAFRLVGRRRGGHGRLRDGHRGPDRGPHDGAPTPGGPGFLRGRSRTVTTDGRPDVGRRGRRRPLIVAWYLSYTAARLDRLHARVEGALSALDAQLVRRAEATARAGQLAACSTRPAR